MLKTLSLSPDETNEESQTDNSESRMLRALEALSSQAPGSANSAHSGAGRDQGGPQPNLYRGNKQHQREPFRNDMQHGAKPRHRFVKDGEVPVVHVAAPRARDAAAPSGVRNDPEIVRLQQLFEEQRVRADQADRAKNDALAQLRASQTKLAHAELALADAAALCQARLDEVMALQDELRLARTPAPRAPAAAPAVAAAPAAAAAPSAGVAADPPKRGPGRPRRIPLVAVLPEPEPEPVQWWLIPSKGQAKGKRRA